MARVPSVECMSTTMISSQNHSESSAPRMNRATFFVGITAATVCRFIHVSSGVRAARASFADPPP